MFGRKQTGEMRLENPMIVAFVDESDDLTVHLDPKQFDGSSEAGVVLADLARHMSRMLNQTRKGDGDDTLTNIIRSLVIELNSPDQTSGNLPN